MPKRIASGTFHLHDFGTEVGEDHRREPACRTFGQVEDAEAVEGSHANNRALESAPTRFDPFRGSGLCCGSALQTAIPFRVIKASSTPDGSRSFARAAPIAR